MVAKTKTINYLTSPTGVLNYHIVGERRRIIKARRKKYKYLTGFGRLSFSTRSRATVSLDE